MVKRIELTDFNAAELDIYARLSEPQLLHIEEPSLGLFIAESPKVITRALDAGYLPVSMLVETKHIEGEAREVIARIGGFPWDVPLFTAPYDVLVRLTGFALKRGVLCAMRRRMLPSVGDILAGKRRVAVLESVTNPTNVGAIFRSAAAMFMDAVLLTPDCSDPLYRRSARVSMGTVFQVPWTYLPGGLEELKRHGFATAAMALLDDTLSVEDRRLKEEEKLAVVLGAEGDGLKPETIAACDYTVKIPMAEGIDSLNVAAASAVAFWELGRNRG